VDIIPDAIIDGLGSGNLWAINGSNAGLVTVVGPVGITGSIVIGSVSAHVDSIYVQSGAQPFGYNNQQIIRKNSGSPAVNYIFSAATNSVMVDNLGSDPVYFKLDATADTGSGSGFLPAGEARSFDVQIGSVSVLGSGTATPSIQCIRLS